MAAIDERIRRQYRTLKEAAVAMRANPQQLSRLRHGRHRSLSVAWLLDLADQVGVTITIDVNAD
jgi:hypothetical protein